MLHTCPEGCCLKLEQAEAALAEGNELLLFHDQNNRDLGRAIELLTIERANLRRELDKARGLVEELFRFYDFSGEHYVEIAGIFEERLREKTRAFLAGRPAPEEKP